MHHAVQFRLITKPSAREAEGPAEHRPERQHNPADPTEVGKRRLLIGETDGGRPLTLVIERSIDPTTWLIVTGWTTTAVERTLVEKAR